MIFVVNWILTAAVIPSALTMPSCYIGRIGLSSDLVDSNLNQPPEAPFSPQTSWPQVRSAVTQHRIENYVYSALFHVPVLHIIMHITPVVCNLFLIILNYVFCRCDQPTGRCVTGGASPGLHHLHPYGINRCRHHTGTCRWSGCQDECCGPRVLSNTH